MYTTLVKYEIWTSIIVNKTCKNVKGPDWTVLLCKQNYNVRGQDWTAFIKCKQNQTNL